MSATLVRALRVIVEVQHLEIQHLTERYAGDSSIPDPIWLSDLGKEGDWIIVSSDPRITRGKVERAAWHESQLTAFFFADGWSSKNLYKQGSDLIGWWPDIFQQARKTPRGHGFLIPSNGRVLKQIYP